MSRILDCLAERDISSSALSGNSFLNYYTKKLVYFQHFETISATRQQKKTVLSTVFAENAEYFCHAEQNCVGFVDGNALAQSL